MRFFNPVRKYLTNGILKTSVVALLILSHAALEAQQTRLTILSSTDTDAITPLLNTFREQNPDISLSYQEIQTAELFKLVNITDPAELEDGNIANEVDLVISSAMDLQVQLVNSGLAHRFETPNTRKVPEWASWRNELYGFTFEPVAMIYNKEAFADRALPTSRSELASMIRDNPEFFENRIGTYDIDISGVGYMFAAQDARYGYQYARLLENFGRANIRTYCCTSLMMSAVRSGQLVMAYNVIGSYVLDALRNKEGIGIHLMDDYSLVLTRTVFIPKSSQQKAAAIRFVDFLLSAQGQELIANNSSLIPIDLNKAVINDVAASFLKKQSPMLPIRLGTGLLTYLDATKKHTFLNEWKQAVDPTISAD